MMNRLVLSVFLCSVGAATLSTDYTTQRTLRIESTTELSLETTESVFEVDGEPREGRGGEAASEERRSVVVLDTVLAQEDGAPTSVKRVFESLEYSGSLSGGGEERELVRETPLEGLTIRLDGEEAEVIDGEEPEDEASLLGHHMTLALDALLPTEEVEVGESWSIDGEDLMRGLGLDLEAQLFPPQPRDEGAGRGGERRREGQGRGARRGQRGGVVALLVSGEWTAKATLESIEDEDGSEQVARVALELECVGELPERQGGRGGRRNRMLQPEFLETSPRENAFTVEVKGSLEFSLEQRRPLGLELEGSIATQRVTERATERGDFYRRSVQEGTFKHTVVIREVEPAASDD